MKVTSRILLIVALLLYTSNVFGTIYYVAPSTATPAGNNANAGTIAAPWLTWSYAFAHAYAGDTVYFRGGVYTSTTSPGGESGFNSGTANNRIYFLNYPGEVPILDCSNRTASSYNRGITIWGPDYLYFKGLTVRNVYQTQIDCNAAGWALENNSGITFENCVTHHVAGEANIVSNYHDTIRYINCDAYNVCDSLRSAVYPTPGSPGQNGGAFHQSNTGDPTAALYYYGCRAWNFSDNGFAGQAVGYVEYDHCWAFHGEGDLSGDGCGFKYASTYGNDNTLDLGRTIKNCISAYNASYGFSPNNSGDTPTAVHFYNNTAYHNGYSGETFGHGLVINAHDTIDDGIKGNAFILPNEKYYNNISYDNELGEVYVSGSLPNLYHHEYNSWDTPPGVTLTDDDFVSLDWTEMLRDRKADNSLPDIDFMKLWPKSDLIDKGYDVDLPYYGTAPDLGYAEYSPGPQIIADHTIVDYWDDIPDRYLDTVKTMLVYFAGQSHAYAHKYGHTLLEAIDADYASNIAIKEGYTDQYLRVNNNPYNTYVYTDTWWTWRSWDVGEEPAVVKDSIKNWIQGYYDDGVPFTAIGFGWCVEMHSSYNSWPTYDEEYPFYWAGNAPGGPDGTTSKGWGLVPLDSLITNNRVNMTDYFAAMEEYRDYVETNSIPTKIIFTTGPLQASGGLASMAAYSAQVKHDYIRNYVLADTTRIMFDYADILAYDDGSDIENLATYSYGGTDYYYQQETATNIGDGTIGHIGSAGAIRLAKAQWWMLARIAGWDGNVSVYSEQVIDSTATDILTFTLPTQTGAATINTTAHTIAIEVAYTADVTDLTPTITLSYGATVIPASGVARDFTNPVPYTVTAEDGVTHQEWTVTVTQEAEPVTPVPTGGAIVKFNGKIVKR
jgi:hypothetical protein